MERPLESEVCKACGRPSAAARPAGRIALEPKSRWQIFRARATPWLQGFLVAALLATLGNAVVVLVKGPEKSELPALSAVTLHLPPASSALQFTEAAYGPGELVMLRFGPVSAAGKADGNGTFFARARPGYLEIDGAQSLAIVAKGCNALQLRPGRPSAKTGATTLTALLPDCSAGLRLAKFSPRETSPELVKALGTASDRVIESADIALESPSSFSLVFGAERKRELLHPLPSVDAVQLELAEAWTIEPGIFRRCECKTDDLVELEGPVTFKTLFIAEGTLHARVELGETVSISCGEGSRSCGFNWRLVNFTGVVQTLFGKLARGAG